eukprot:CAMPEP_0201491712 /NCGR_PEP_ID=MMETSP0151_2-20130828/30917_1 /ASSEMBLY_ACC=CAM_ASM_000257 /TAXON_ID=200890 /ORGANISM="Paramoeba atlantica, Strain 621/1 / CCAP 1560/9" /LENGTH=342 /DNA_ID=CAMNT_0047878193 /DNA_START=35 /DNA_END=1063 /DNA_ORIENTATION=+
MKVILLKGHGRGITQLRYNREGDLLFTASKGKEINVWRSDNGERVGSYHGHNGAVYAIDVDRKSTRLISAGADNYVKIWDIESGQELFSTSLSTPGRAINFAQGDKLFACATENVLGYHSAILFFPFSEDKDKLKDDPISKIQVNPKGLKILDLAFGHLNTNLFAATDKGKVLVYDTETRKLIHEITDNNEETEVKRLTMSRDRMSFLTSSTDHTARLYDVRSYKMVKLYETGRPCNSADFSPKMNHILLGGGQSASEVTMTRVDPTQFACRVHHKIFQEELALIPGHFGPVNDIRVNPDGQSFATGGEDGYVRLNFFDDSYFKGLSDDVYFKKLNERVQLR